MTYDLCARIRVTDPEKRQTARNELARLQALTRQEEKCLLFTVLEDVEWPGDFLLWESWREKEGLDAHFAAEHTRRYLDLQLTEVVEITELNPVEAVSR